MSRLALRKNSTVVSGTTVPYGTGIDHEKRSTAPLQKQVRGLLRRAHRPRCQKAGIWIPDPPGERRCVRVVRGRQRYVERHDRRTDQRSELSGNRNQIERFRSQFLNHVYSIVIYRAIKCPLFIPPNTEFWRRRDCRMDWTQNRRECWLQNINVRCCRGPRPLWAYPVRPASTVSIPSAARFHCEHTQCSPRPLWAYPVRPASTVSIPSAARFHCEHTQCGPRPLWANPVRHASTVSIPSAVPASTETLPITTFMGLTIVNGCRVGGGLIHVLVCNKRLFDAILAT